MPFSIFTFSTNYRANVFSEDKNALAKLIEAVRGNYLDRFDEVSKDLKYTAAMMQKNFFTRI